METLNYAKQTFALEISALMRTSELLNSDFEKAVELIASSHKIIVSGVGKSGLIGQKIAATLSSIGVSAVFLHPVEALHGDIGMVQKDDVALLISKSGNTAELVRTIPYLKMRSARIISIVGNMSSHLASCLRCCIGRFGRT
jgi:arabinose-5-phosphate isomerase